MSDDNTTAKTMLALAGATLIPVVWRPWKDTRWWFSEETSVAFRQVTRATGEIVWTDARSHRRERNTVRFRVDFKNLCCIAEQIAAESMLDWDE